MTRTEKIEMLQKVVLHDSGEITKNYKNRNELDKFLEDLKDVEDCENCSCKQFCDDYM